MKKISMLALASLCSMGLLSACSDSGSSAPSRAELCANGISDDCLVGAWNAIGLTSNATGDKYALADFSAAPGTLTFNKDKTFQFDAPTAPTAASIATPDCNPVYGEWNVVAGVLNMVAGTGSLCMGPKNVDLHATVAVDELGNVTLKFGQLYYTYNLVDDASVRASYTETYTISANQ